MGENESNHAKSGPVVGDLAGVGEIIKSDVAKDVYKDALSSPMRQIGELTEDALKAFRLFLAPVQLLAAYQDRLKKFCEKVRDKVPVQEQCDAPPEIAKPVLEAIASTSDDSPLMVMFEELMSRAIDKREDGKLSPQFPQIIKSLSPLEAVLITDIAQYERYTDDLFNRPKFHMLRRVGTNFDYSRYGNGDHHLTISQRLVEMKLIVMIERQPIPPNIYPDFAIPQGLEFSRTIYRLSMFGKWFSAKCTPATTASVQIHN